MNVMVMKSQNDTELYVKFWLSDNPAYTPNCNGVIGYDVYNEKSEIVDGGEMDFNSSNYNEYLTIDEDKELLTDLFNYINVDFGNSYVTYEINEIKENNILKDDDDYLISFIFIRNSYPNIAQCRDNQYLYDHLNKFELQLIENILQAESEGKIGLPEDRHDENGNIDFEKLDIVIYDESYVQKGYELLVLKWLNDFEDTGYLVECIKA